MGVFFDSQPRHDQMQKVIHDALVAPAPQDPDGVADKLASAALADAPSRFQVGRFIGAAIIFLVLAAGGVITDNMKLAASSAALFAMATTVLGVVVAFFGTEKSTGG